jgi:rhodanese-related sulfurtransferase
MDQKQPFKLFDVRREEADYKKGHIRGAIYVSPNQVTFKAYELCRQDDEIIIYDADDQAPASQVAANKLLLWGYRNVIEYKGGFKDWQENGYPVEVTETPAAEAEKPQKKRKAAVAEEE